MHSKAESPTIQFLGAAGTVTGSKYLIHFGEKRILVDCGLFQGLKELRILNWQKFPIDPSLVDAIFLTHGHLDHVGYLPRLVKGGFSGPIYGTQPTLEIAEIILKDSAEIQMEDAARANKYNFSKHKPALPLYDLDDVEETLKLFVNVEEGKWLDPEKGWPCRFNYNSHILGASFIEFKIGGKLVVFSGDIGREDDKLLRPPKKPANADVLVMESTYGDKLHPKTSEEQLSEIINDAAHRNGAVIIPGFAVERAQLLMYLILQLKKTSKIPDVPVYLDTPMGTNVLEVFKRHLSWHKLSAHDCEELSRKIRITKKVEDTERIISEKGSKIVIAGSGMAGGGRVLMYFQKYLGDPSSVILLAGYQAEGTRGRRLLDGEKEIKLFGKFYPVKANIKSIEGLSSHADQAGLINWLGSLEKKPERIFLTHGEENSLSGLQKKISEVYGWNAEIPSLNRRENL